MKKIILLLTALFLIFTLFSCEKQISAEAILTEFISTYGAEGIVYSSAKGREEEGYISEELSSKIYIYEGDFPRNFAIYLNSHSHKGSEAAVFVCRNEDERQKVTEACLERMKLIAAKQEDRVIVRIGNTVAYSTLGDGERTGELLAKIIRAHS